MDPQLLRREAGRMIAALTRVFGVHNLPLAEDVVQDAIASALVAWKTSGAPDNAAAWLMATAKRRAIDVVRRERNARRFAPELGRLLDSEWTLRPLVDEAFDASVIADEQLRMMFSCCQPRLGEEVQIALILNLLCGFGAAEIADAFLTGRAAIEKRITRGKRSLAEAKKLFDLADADLDARRGAVLRALYLLFNEGYQRASLVSQRELCGEALRLGALLVAQPRASTPSANALVAMMCLHAARLPARFDPSGELVPLDAQDRARWDAQLVDHGLAAFDRAATGDALSTYHVEAAIAVVHASAASVAETDWTTIAQLYDQLLALAPTPVVALNRAIAIGRAQGVAPGLAALAAIEDTGRLGRYPFHPAAFGELELRRGGREAARGYFRRALAVARNEAERRFLQKRLGEI